MVEIAAVILAAGSGSRLRPLTDIHPKALCPVNNVPLVDYAIERVSAFTSSIAVNVHHHKKQMVEHLKDRAYLSSEEPELLGTAGALGALKEWIDRRPVIVHNADAWHLADLSDFVSGWDGKSVRLLVTPDDDRGDFGPWRFCGVSLMPWESVKKFEPKFSGLWKSSWEDLWARKQLDLVSYDGPFFDCGTPTDYLAANMTASGGKNVIGQGAKIEGTIERSVVWAAGHVKAGEHLTDVIRVGTDITLHGSSQSSLVSR